MQTNSIHSTNFGNLQINDHRISANYQKAIQHDLKNEVKKLDKAGFDVVIEEEPHSPEYFERKNSDVFLKSKNADKEMYIATIQRDSHFNFSNSLNALKEILSVLS